MKKVKAEIKEVETLLTDMPAWVLALFTAGCIAMNLMANKSIDLPFSWLALDCGILASWVPFMCMDVIVKRYGAKASITVSLVAIMINLLYNALFFVGAHVSGVWGASYETEAVNAVNTALDTTFAGTWYVLLGSTVAFIVSSIVNSMLNETIGKQLKKDNFSAFAIRSYASTIIGQFVDNLTFALIVSVNFFGWTLTQCITCALFGAIAELIMETLFSPIGYKVSKRWAKADIGNRYRQEYLSGANA